MALTKPQGNMLMKLGTEQASTSGTAIDFTGIPAGTTTIIVMIESTSTNGTGAYYMQLGDSGGIETTGYAGNVTVLPSGGVTGSAVLSTNFSFSGTAVAAATYHGQFMLTLTDSANNTWCCSGQWGRSDTVGTYGVFVGHKSLTGVLDRVRLANVSGDTFDAGSINIAYF